MLGSQQPSPPPDSNNSSRPPTPPSQADGSDYDPEEKLIQEVINIRERDKRQFEEIATKGHTFTVHGKYLIFRTGRCALFFMLRVDRVR